MAEAPSQQWLGAGQQVAGRGNAQNAVAPDAVPWQKARALMRTTQLLLAIVFVALGASCMRKPNPAGAIMLCYGLLWLICAVGVRRDRRWAYQRTAIFILPVWVLLGLESVRRAHAVWTGAGHGGAPVFGLILVLLVFLALSGVLGWLWVLARRARPAPAAQARPRAAAPALGS